MVQSHAMRDSSMLVNVISFSAAISTQWEQALIDSVPQDAEPWRCLGMECIMYVCVERCLWIPWRCLGIPGAESLVEENPTLIDSDSESGSVSILLDLDLQDKEVVATDRSGSCNGYRIQF